MVVTTRSGSRYEVEGLRVRRLLGPEYRIKPFWRTAVEVSAPAIGEALVIRWGDDVPALVEGTEPFAKLTVTSPVTAID